MHNQAMATESKSSMFTSLYGFMRVVVADAKTLHISPNIMIGTGSDDSHRRKIDVNSKIMQEIFLFIFGAVVRTYSREVILPPSFLREYHDPAYTQIIPPQPSFSLQQRLIHYTSSIGTQVLGTKALVWSLVLKVCGAQLLTYAADFEIPSVLGLFERHDNRQVVCLS